MNRNGTYDFSFEGCIDREKILANNWRLNISIDDSSGTSQGKKIFDIDDAMKYIPADIIRELSEEAFEAGMKVYGEDFFCKILDEKQGGVIVNNAVSGLYTNAVAKEKRNLAFNIVLLYSHLPYSKLGQLASLMAMGMTRSPYPEVQEMAIQCFENWEDRSAGEFLAGCKFAEMWLQEYADEVCEYLRVEGKDVLFTENKSWEMAGKEWKWGSSNVSQRCEGRCNYSGTEIFWG